MFRWVKQILFLIFIISMTFVPTASPVQAQPRCGNAPSPRLEVGKFAVISSPDTAEYYAGNIYASLDQGWGIDDPRATDDGLQAAVLSDFSPETDSVTPKLVSEGPICFKNRYWWRLRLGTGVNPWIISRQWKAYDAPDGGMAWMPESVGKDYVLKPDSFLPDSTSPYQPKVADISTLKPSRKVSNDALAEIFYGGRGGGPNSGEVLQFATLPDYGATTLLGEATSQSFSLFPKGKVVTIRILQPDGQPFGVPREFYPWLLLGWRQGSATPSLPYWPGLPTGIWTIEITSGTTTRYVAYELRPPPNPALSIACELGNKVIYASGLAGMERFSLVKVELTNDDMSKMIERQRWNLQADAQGTLVIVNLPQPSQLEYSLDYLYVLDRPDRPLKIDFLADQVYDMRPDLPAVPYDWNCFRKLPHSAPEQICETVNGPTLPPRLIPGQKAHITPGDANTLRAEPDKSSAAVGRAPGGSEIDVIDGPVCGLGGTFWQVRYKEKVGWTLEGDIRTYWIVPD